MGLPVTIYRYTDAGAPQLTNGTPSEWMDILKKCLVSGYGSKAGLGWTIEFENAGAYKIAFRNKVADGGSGGYVQFWSSTGANAAYTSINMQTAASMSALDTFVKPGYGRQLYVIGVAMRGWEIIGTSRGFWVILHPTTSTNNPGASSNGYMQQYFIGDIESTGVNDDGIFTIVSGQLSASDTYSSSSYGVGASFDMLYARLYGVDGSNSSQMYSASKVYPMGNQLDGGNAESLGINHVMVRPVLTGDIIQHNNSTVLPYVRGFVPGLYISSFTGYKSENWPKDLTLNGVVWTMFRSYYSPRVWIKTGTWYD